MPSRYKYKPQLTKEQANARTRKRSKGVMKALKEAELKKQGLTLGRRFRKKDNKTGKPRTKRRLSRRSKRRLRQRQRSLAGKRQGHSYRW